MQRRRFLNSALALGLAAPFALPASEAPVEARELSFDLVIVGSGAAGLSAAVSALQSGARRVALLEKAPLLGGHSILSTGSVSVAFPDSETGERDENIERFVRDTLEAGGSESDPELVRLLAQKSYDAVIWLIQLGVRWNLEPFRAVSSTAVRNISTGSVRAGYDYVQTLLSAAKRLGVDIHYRTRAEALLTEAGRVTGVLARDPRGEPLRFCAPAVVLATGGFTANPVMRRRFDPRLHEGLRTTANPEGQTLDGATGDGIAMAEKIGAKTVGMPHIQLIPFIGGRVTDYAGAEVWVNARGERFVNEEERFGALYEAILKQPDARFWVITDSQSKKNATFGPKLARGAVRAAANLEEVAQAMEIPEASRNPSPLQRSGRPKPRRPLRAHRLYAAHRHAALLLRRRALRRALHLRRSRDRHARARSRPLREPDSRPFRRGRNDGRYSWKRSPRRQQSHRLLRIRPHCGRGGGRRAKVNRSRTPPAGGIRKTEGSIG